MVLVTLLALSRLAAADVTPATTMAGHQVVFGERRVPVIGKLKTRTDTWVLARVERDGGDIVLHQRACKVKIARVAGVSVSMDASSLPETEMRFRPTQDGIAMRGRAVHAWGGEDVDRDGHPGLTVHVNAPICSGALYVTNRSVTTARAWVADGGLRGKHEVRVQQRVLGARGACLSATAKDTDERVRGHFTFVPVAATTSCQDLTRRGWPVGP